MLQLPARLRRVLAAASLLPLTPSPTQWKVNTQGRGRALLRAGIPEALAQERLISSRFTIPLGPSITPQDSTPPPPHPTVAPWEALYSTLAARGAGSPGSTPGSHFEELL